MLDLRSHSHTHTSLLPRCWVVSVNSLCAFVATLILRGSRFERRDKTMYTFILSRVYKERDLNILSLQSSLTDLHRNCVENNYFVSPATYEYLWFYYFITLAPVHSFCIHITVVLLILVQVLLYISKIMKPRLRHHHK